MKGDPEKGGKIENRDRLYFHARFGLSILRKSEKRREEETEEKSEISFRCTTGCVREKWDRREEPVSPYFRSLTVILELDSELRFSKEWIPDRSSITG